jgi:hypothetical protein
LLKCLVVFLGGSKGCDERRGSGGSVKGVLVFWIEDFADLFPVFESGFKGNGSVV